MVWTEITRRQYRRHGLRDASDATDEEWLEIAPHLPAPSWRGRPCRTEMRAVVDANLYLAQAGCQWRMLPKDFPPYSMVQRYFYRWRNGGLWKSINHALVMLERERQGRESSPSAGMIDSQSVKTTEAEGPRGYAAEKMIKGRESHLITNTIVLLIGAVVHAADIQDRDGAPLLLALIRRAFLWLPHDFADAAYAGDKLQQALARLGT